MKMVHDLLATCTVFDEDGTRSAGYLYSFLYSFYSKIYS